MNIPSTSELFIVKAEAIPVGVSDSVKASLASLQVTA